MRLRFWRKPPERLFFMNFGIEDDDARVIDTHAREFVKSIAYKKAPRNQTWELVLRGHRHEDDLKGVVGRWIAGTTGTDGRR